MSTEQNRSRLAQIGIMDVVRSQASVIRKKRELLAGQLYWARRKYGEVPVKRISPDRSAYHAHRARLRLRAKVVKETRTFLQGYHGASSGWGIDPAVRELGKRLARAHRAEMWRQKALKLLRNPARAVFVWRIVVDALSRSAKQTGKK